MSEQLSQFISSGNPVVGLELTLSKVAMNLALALPLIIISGCSNTAQTTENTEKQLQKDAFTAIRSDSFHFDWDSEIDPINDSFEHCIADAVSNRLPDLRYVSRDTFTQEMFPNLPQESAPLDLKSMTVLLGSEQFHERLNTLNMRYIIYVTGYTEIKESHTWLAVFGYRFVTGVGMSEWDKETDVSTVVFDLKSSAELERTSNRTAGKSWIAGIFPIVVGVPANTEDAACHAVGIEIASVIEAARTAEN